MSFRKNLLVGILVLLPVLAAFWMPIGPLPDELASARKTASAAKFSGNAEAESAALETVLGYAPWEGKTWQRLGRLELDAGHYGDAVNAFDQASKLGQLTAEGRLWMSDALISNGEGERAKEMLRQFPGSKGTDAFLNLQAAMLQRSLNDPFGALTTLLIAYNSDPLNGEINYQTGLQLAAIEPDRSLDFLKRAADLNADHLATCQALETVIRDTSSLGESGARYLAIGRQLSLLEEWDVAERAFQKAVELDGQNGIAWSLLAESAQQNGEDGEIYILKARELAPDEEMVNGLTGLYYRRTGKSELALVYLQKALDANPTAGVWEIEIANTLDGRGDLAGALAHFQSATTIAPKDWTSWRALASFCITRNYQLLEVGIPAARRALQLNPSSPVLLDLLGTALMMDGELDESLGYFLKADALDPHQSAILIHLGQAYQAKEDAENASFYFQQAIQYARNERLSEMARRLLQEIEAK